MKNDKPKVFLSHSLEEDEVYVNVLKKILSPTMNLIVAKEIIANAGETVTIKINKLLKESKIGIILMSDKSYRSPFVNQEIGFLEGIGTSYIIIKTNNFNQQLTGFLYGRADILDWTEDENKLKEQIKQSFSNVSQDELNEEITKIITEREEYVNIKHKDYTNIVYITGIVIIAALIIILLNKKNKLNQ
jgi:hypothetical protein